jgi:hypothetical protein
MTSMSDPSFDLDLAAATIRSNSSDVHALLRALVGQLQDTLGDSVTVTRAGGLLHKSDEIKSVEVAVGSETLRAEVAGSRVTCSVAHSSGGIRIRSEAVDLDEWLRRLLSALQAEASHSDAARQALEQVVIGGPS